MYYLLLSHGNNGYANAPQCYVIRTLPVFYNLPWISVSLRHTKQHAINTYSGIKISFQEFLTYALDGADFCPGEKWPVGTVKWLEGLVWTLLTAATF
jgi:hypothetical protein